jgi:hypothetical protein
MAKLPIGRITFFQPDYFVGSDALRAWPCRMTDRETIDKQNVDLGETVEHLLHGRPVKGRGDRYSEWFRRNHMVFPGQIISDIMFEMLDSWMIENYMVKDVAGAPQKRIQFMWANPLTSTAAEPNAFQIEAFLHRVRTRPLSIRGFYINHNPLKAYDSVAINFGPCHNKNEIGPTADWNFSRVGSYLFIDFDHIDLINNTYI